jgi:hypothetical protein
MHNLTQALIFFLQHRSGLEIPDYNLKITNDGAGRYEPYTKNLVIPKWIFSSDCKTRPSEEYCIYYIAHELSHVCVGEEEEAEHGILFYHYLNKLCPPDLIHWELEYLPENEIYLNV